VSATPLEEFEKALMKEEREEFSDVDAQCVDMNKLKNELDSTKKELSDSRKEQLLLKTSLVFHF